MKYRVYILLFFVSGFFYLAGCESDRSNPYVRDFEWMVKTFEENDAGYKYYIEEKGAEDYARHVADYRAKIRQAKNEQEFLSLMNGWLHYFRKRHIGVFPVGSNPIYDKPLTQTQQDSIRASLADTERVDMDERQFRRYLTENEANLSHLEGIWKTKNSIMGIIRSKANSAQFDIFSIESSNPYTVPGLIVSTLTEKGENELMIEDVGSRREGRVERIGKSDGLLRAQTILIKEYPEIEFSGNEKFFTEVMLANEPFLKKLNDKTLYLRLPSFHASQKKGIDELLKANDKLIRSTPNLIVDIRYGTGGSDGSHSGLIPYYYTQPIRVIGNKLRATELNAQGYEKYAEMHSDSAMGRYFLNKAKEIRENIGDYIDQMTPVGDYYRHLENLKYPERVAVITKNNGSADEALLYNARQSYKTKIFGHTSMGAFDMSNVNIVESPNGRYNLWLAMTVSGRYPRYVIDDIGIQPDFYIDEYISEENWVEYVQCVIEAR